MQVRVLRHAQPGSSVYGLIEPENSGGADSGFREHVIEPTTPVADIQVHAIEPLVVRSVPIDDAPAWLPGPRAEFLAWCHQLEQSTPSPLCIWPTALGAVSDAPSLRTFLAAAEQRGRPWTFLFDPISLLTPTMLPNAEDHLTRLFELLAGHPARHATVLADAAVLNDAVVPAPLGSGSLTAIVLDRARPRPEQVVLLDADLPRQLALL